MEIVNEDTNQIMDSWDSTLDGLISRHTRESDSQRMDKNVLTKSKDISPSRASRIVFLSMLME